MIYLNLILSAVLIFIVPELLANKRDTETYIENTCVLKADPGKRCKGEKEDKFYFFNVKTFRCGSFNYLGCEGNANRFNTFDDCVDSCQTPWFALKNSEKKEETPRTKSDCDLDPAVGDCKALIPMWHFDKATKKCFGFSYGGCGGNGNRFNEEDECLDFCTQDVL